LIFSGTFGEGTDEEHVNHTSLLNEGMDSSGSHFSTPAGAIPNRSSISSGPSIQNVASLAANRRTNNLIDSMLRKVDVSNI
jgi:hypothetical protein